MATAVAHPDTPAQTATQLPGRRFDHLFFSGMALLMLCHDFCGLRGYLLPRRSVPRAAAQPDHSPARLRSSRAGFSCC